MPYVFSVVEKVFGFKDYCLKKWTEIIAPLEARELQKPKCYACVVH